MTCSLLLIGEKYNFTRLPKYERSVLKFRQFKIFKNFVFEYSKVSDSNWIQTIHTHLIRGSYATHILITQNDEIECKRIIKIYLEHTRAMCHAKI